MSNIDLRELKRLVEDGAIDTVLVVFPDMYGRLVGKRIVGRFFVEQSEIHACDYLLACDIDMDPVPGYQFTSWAKGYGDFRPVPDFKTLRVASWLDKTAMVLCDVYEEERDELVPFAPRGILRKQLARAAEQGYVAMGASELELYVFKDSYEEIAKKGFINIEPIGRLIEDYHIFQGTKEEFLIGDIRRHLERSGIPVESSKGEWGPGQQEIGLRYAELLEMADRHTIYKHAAKEIAWQHGKSVTFMAKWDERYAGSSCHIHASLWNPNGEPLFNPSAGGDEPLGPIRCSPLFRWFLGGWMKHIRELFPFFAPYPSSYKRYVAGSFAPTGIAWSYDNRTAGFRIVGHGSSLRIECRMPGADANVYLAFAATLAAGLDGIANRIEPPDAFEGDVYGAMNLPQVPHSLRESIEALEQSEFARAAFGDDVIEHYLHFFRTEQRKFDAVVTDWERKRYFEQA
ncbi:MAG TPA: glutamine synthetase family protein [Thermoanaerobaculia bacterium]|jgi:glutamine synthetase|nr:glutamine synthetase family protein [Thermoanaerobaculia bacterium]